MVVRSATSNPSWTLRIDSAPGFRVGFASLGFASGGVQSMRKILLGSLLLLSLACACAACVFWAMGKPSLWGFQKSAYEKADRVNPPKAGVIVFTGSSSIRFWQTLANDMKPLEVINRGFGGSQIADVNEYASRIIIPYRPRAVIRAGADSCWLGFRAHASPRTIRSLPLPLFELHPSAWS